ncbi:MAG: transcription termination/antitermination protein NusG [Thalassobaculaceae bacterium]|nr:transcription termination/antitermination protein NusG [Thalassobaculaceae bacterium]
MAQRWYVVQTYSGFEKKVAQSINEQVAQLDFGDLISEVLVPTEEVIEMRRGVKATTERKFFPGYILVRMELTDESWHLVKSQPKVAGFVGGKSKPIPITDAEATRLLKQVSEGVDRPKPSVTFEIGEQVRVADGPFATFNGLVEDVDEERSRLKVAVSIFGRSTPVDLDFTQVEKT